MRMIQKADSEKSVVVEVADFNPFFSLPEACDWETISFIVPPEFRYASPLLYRRGPGFCEAG